MHSMFCFLCFFIFMFWPGMVLNQGQLSIVVSDWESYLGSPFPFLSLWEVVFVRGTIALVSVTVVFVVSGLRHIASESGLRQM